MSIKNKFEGQKIIIVIVIVIVIVILSVILIVMIIVIAILIVIVVVIILGITVKLKRSNFFLMLVNFFLMLIKLLFDALSIFLLMSMPGKLGYDQVFTVYRLGFANFVCITRFAGARVYVSGPNKFNHFCAFICPVFSLTLLHYWCNEAHPPEIFSYPRLSGFFHNAQDGTE